MNTRMIMVLAVAAAIAPVGAEPSFGMTQDRTPFHFCIDNAPDTDSYLTSYFACIDMLHKDSGTSGVDGEYVR